MRQYRGLYSRIAQRKSTAFTRRGSGVQIPLRLSFKRRSSGTQKVERGEVYANMDALCQVTTQSRAHGGNHLCERQRDAVTFLWVRFPPGGSSEILYHK